MADVSIWFEIARWFETKAGILNLVLMLWIVWAEARLFFAIRWAKNLNSKMIALMLDDVAAKAELTHAIDKVIDAKG